MSDVSTLEDKGKAKLIPLARALAGDFKKAVDSDACVIASSNQRYPRPASESGVNNGHRLLTIICTIALILTWGKNMNADAGILGFGGASWKEEALLHDGSKIIVTRTVERGGRHEIGQAPPYRLQQLTFIEPRTSRRVIWKDHFSEDLGTANFLPMLIDIVGDTPYLVVSAMGCLSYNKWGRPNPPYIVFKNEEKEWKRIPLQELPAQIIKSNLIFSAPDDAVEKLGKNYASAEMIQKIIGEYRHPEYKTILREPLPNDRINQMCEERVLYKGSWILPNDPIARNFIDQQNR